MIDITNFGATCRLSGYPNLFGSTATRAPSILKVREDGTYFGNLVPADLSRGQSGALLIGTGDACNALNQPSQSKIAAIMRANTYRRVSIILPGGDSLNYVNVTFDTACGVEESQLGVQPLTPEEIAAPPGTLQSLEATIEIGSYLQSGRTIRYRVSLLNPGPKTVKWSSCPNYTESILVLPQVGGPRRFSYTYQLNCARAKSVPPHHKVTFDMQLVLGPTPRSGESKFSWQLDTGYGPYAGRGLYVFASN